MILKPEIGVPYSEDIPYMDLRARAEAACNTINELHKHGLEVDPKPEDRVTAAELAAEYAENPEKISKQTNNKAIAKMTPASLVLTNNILQEFGQAVAQSAAQIRHMVTNKLILESDNPDPRIRIRALELLGKMSDVGLFTEKSEVTVTHQTTDEIRDKLRAKLAKLVNPEEVEDAIIIDGEEIDVAKELGISDE